jgi:hypothetical protein
MAARHGMRFYLEDMPLPPVALTVCWAQTMDHVVCQQTDQHQAAQQSHVGLATHELQQFMR